MNLDTKRADGVYVQFEKEEVPDGWGYIGIRAKANIIIIQNGTGTLYSVTSAGLWGCASDSEEEYLNEVYEEEKSTLREHLKLMATFVEE